MKCIEVRKNIDIFADGETDEVLTRSIESHLGNCANCSSVLINLQKTSAAVKRVLPVEAPEFLDQRVLNAFQKHHAQQEASKESEDAGWPGIPRLAFAAAFLLLALVSALAFQLGRISVTNLESSLQENRDMRRESGSAPKSPPEDRSRDIKVAEVPIAEERIVKVPVIKVKEVIKTIYLDPKRNGREQQNGLNAEKKTFRSQTAFSGFQPASDLNPQVIETMDTDPEFKIAPDLNPTVINEGETDEE